MGQQCSTRDVLKVSMSVARIALFCLWRSSGGQRARIVGTSDKYFRPQRRSFGRSCVAQAKACLIGNFPIVRNIQLGAGVEANCQCTEFGVHARSCHITAGRKRLTGASWHHLICTFISVLRCDDNFSGTFSGITTASRQRKDSVRIPGHRPL